MGSGAARRCAWTPGSELVGARAGPPASAERRARPPVGEGVVPVAVAVGQRHRPVGAGVLDDVAALADVVARTRTPWPRAGRAGGDHRPAPRRGEPMIRVELVKMVRRPRTWITILLLNALPTLVAVLLAVTDIGPQPGEGPAFLSAVLTDGKLFPLAALAIVLPLFMPVAVAVVAGDAVAGEASGGTLRYVLTRPVGRTRLLVAKLVSVIAFVLLAVVVVAAIGYVVGKLLLGGGDATGLVTGVSGNSLGTTELVERTLMSIVYVTLSMLGVASMALMLSTMTDSAVGAALGALAFLIASALLLTLDAASALQPYLPTRYWLSFVDLFRDPILWRDIVRGVLLQGVYVLVFLGAGWANFATKDITS